MGREKMAVAREERKSVSHPGITRDGLGHWLYLKRRLEKKERQKVANLNPKGGPRLSDPPLTREEGMGGER